LALTSIITYTWENRPPLILITQGFHSYPPVRGVMASERARRSATGAQRRAARTTLARSATDASSRPHARPPRFAPSIPTGTARVPTACYAAHVVESGTLWRRFRMTQRSLLIRAATVCAILSLGACSGVPVTNTCGVAGRERMCEPCTTKQIGIQTCQLDGSWSQCECYPLNAGSGATGSNGRGAGSGGASTKSSGLEIEQGGLGAGGFGGSLGQGQGGDTAESGGRAGAPLSAAGRRSPFPSRR
jgi:hypothetical protein